MKKFMFYILTISSSLLFVGSIYATTTDTQLIDLENKAKLGQIQQLNSDFHLKKFTSCQNMEDTITTYIKTYFKSFPNRWGGMIDSPMLQFDVMNDAVIKEASPTAGATTESINGTDTSKSSDYSTTNIQVVGVDESELVKTDGKNIYFYNAKNHSIYITKAFPVEELSILKIIKIPSSFVNPELYISGNKLIVMATKYSNSKYSYYWFARDTKTAVVVYNISNIDNLTIDKYYVVDGENIKSRMIGKYLYTLSKVNFSFPYRTYYSEGLDGEEGSLNTKSIDQDFSANKVLPKKVELRKTSKISEQNVRVKGTKIPYNLSQNTAGNCTDIEYVMPDETTIKKYNFNPSYVVLSILNTENPTESVKTKILFGDVSEIHMSLDNLYIASNLYVSYDFSCPQIRCITTPCPVYDCMMPYYYRGENTLLHKISISGNIAQYKNSNIIPGRPLNQYSMDQNDAGYFRIITSNSYPTQGTNLFILDKNLASVGNLTGLAEGENFQSSRFIGDKLYLVTFQQIDPLFVIDVSDNTNPKILGELKIPGYSTYLHPYDSTHLIGLGYNTKTNQWGGTTNAGLKVDLYDISDFKNPKQQYSLTLGDQGSSSDVLHNPRLFVWNSTKKLLFLPATLYTNAGDTKDTYRNKDAFQGTIAVNIDKDKGISKVSEITHINTNSLATKRAEECKQYSVQSTEPCKEIIGGGTYCPPVSNYVPTYCYSDSLIGEYFANQIWNFNSSFIIRNLYLDNTLFTISNDKIQSNDMDNNFSKEGEVKMN